MDQVSISEPLQFSQPPLYHVGGVPIRGRVILAPMDGLSDPPTRLLYHRYGSAISYTEFLNTIDILNWNRNIETRSFFSEEERPVAFQLLDNDPDRMLEAAQMIFPRNPDIFDINFGCPARLVTSRGAGASLMRQPDLIAKMISQFNREFNIPVTAKIRLGWDDKSMNYLEVAKVIEQSGGALVAVHGRTRAQGYSGTARWEPIAEVKSTVQIPVIANGDIRTVQDIQKVIALTGCDGVMIGRAAMGNPWIFSGIDKHNVILGKRIPVIMEHLSLMTEFYGQDFGVLLFRKHLKAYLRDLPIEKEDILGLVTSPRIEDVADRLLGIETKYYEMDGGRDG